MASIGYIRSRKRWRIRWHITCYDGTIDKGGKVFRFKSDAIEFRKIIERREDRLKAGLVKPSELIHTAVQKWLKYNNRHTTRCQQHYTMVIKKFIESLPGQVSDIRQIDTGGIQGYISEKIADLTNNGSCNPNRTANAHLTALKSFTRWLSDTYKIPNAAGGIKTLKENPPDARFLTPKEYKAVLGVVDGDDRDVLVFIANTGLRATELCELTGRCVSQDKNRLVIVGKGRKQRAIPLNVTCKAILKRLHPKPNTRIFFSKSTCKQPRALLYKICEKAAEAAEIPKFGPHSLRHYFATELARLNVSISRISKLLGHSSIRTTEQAYIHFLPDYLAGTTDVLVSPQ